MRKEPLNPSAPKAGVRRPQRVKHDKQSEELLREQSKTEIEEKPYLDTEGSD
jgi:hypothetical protein